MIVDKVVLSVESTENGEAISIDRSPTAKSKGGELGRFILSLGLPTEKNNALIDLMTDYINQVEADAFAAGGILGGKAALMNGESESAGNGSGLIQ